MADAKISINENALKAVSHCKYLGMNLDSRLSWSKHVAEVKKKAFKALNILRALTAKHWGADPAFLTMFYKLLVRSKIEYDAVIFGSASKTQINSLEKVQNAALRCITGALKTSPIAALQAETGIPPLSYRFKSLAHNYIIRNISLTGDSIVSSYLFIKDNWRFTVSKTPLHSQSAHHYRKISKHVFKVDTYSFTHLPYNELYSTLPYYKFKIPEDLTNSPNSVINSLFNE